MVPFIGIYSSPEHPSALIFEFMEQLNLREYLRNNRGVRRLELVGSNCIFPTHHLNVSWSAVGDSTRCGTNPQAEHRPREP